MTYQQPPFYPQQHQQPYGGGLPYYDGAARPPRPGSVTTLAIIGIVLASIGILNNLGGVALYAWAQSQSSQPAFMSSQQGEVGAINFAGSVVSLCLALYLLVAAIAALRLRPWGRTELRRYAVISLVWLVVWTVLAYGWLLPATIAAQKGLAGGAGLPPGTEVGMYAGAGFVLLLMSIYPVFLLVWMGKRHVRAAFNGEWPAPVSAAFAAAAPAPGAWPPPPPGQYAPRPPGEN